MTGITLITLAVVLLVVLALYNGFRSWVTYKQDGIFSYQWQSVLDFAFTAVAAVSQTHKEKPAEMLEEEWDELRLKEAMVMIESFAQQFGIVITADNYAAIRAAIEYAVSERKPKPSSESVATLRSTYGLPPLVF